MTNHSGEPSNFYQKGAFTPKKRGRAPKKPERASEQILQLLQAVQSDSVRME